MIIKARQNHIPQLINIWKTVFQDEDDFIQGFFREVFPYVKSYCWEENDVLAAMLYAIPCLVKDINGTLRKSYYFYALATLKEYRGLGIMEKLIKHTLTIHKTDCDFFFLVPAQASLLQYYEKFGFHRLAEGHFLSEKDSRTVFFPKELEQFFMKFSGEKPYLQPELIAGMGDSAILKPNGWIPL